MASASSDWRATILTETGDARKMAKGGSGDSSFHCPIDSMAALLGNLLCWHEEGISNAEWGERFYQWGVAAGISKGTLHTITFSMIEIARTLTWVGEDESGEDSAGGSYSPTKSKIGGDAMADFLGTYTMSVDVAPLSAVPGLGKVTCAALASGGGGLGSGWEPPAPGQDDSYKIPITSFPCLMGHLLVFHQEDINAQLWGERFFQWGAAIGMKKQLLHPIVCALLAVAETMPCVPDDTVDGLDAFASDTEFTTAKSGTSADALASFLEKTADGCIPVTAVPSIGPVTAATLAEDHYEL